MKWRTSLDAVLALPNVEHKPHVSDRENATYGWSSAVHWLPYDAALPFNTACCPLRLFTALASGRAIVSAPIPECALYPQWVRTYSNSNAVEAVDAIRRSLDESRDASAQIAFARANTWQQRASSFVNLIEDRRPVEMYA